MRVARPVFLTGDQKVSYRAPGYSKEIKGQNQEYRGVMGRHEVGGLAKRLSTVERKRIWKVPTAAGRQKQ